MILDNGSEFDKSDELIKADLVEHGGSKKPVNSTALMLFLNFAARIFTMIRFLFHVISYGNK